MKYRANPTDENIRSDLAAMGIEMLAREVFIDSVPHAYYRQFWPKDYIEIKQFVLYVVLDSVQE